MATAPERRPKRKCLPFSTKLCIIEEVERKQKTKAAISRDFGIASSSLETLLKNKEKIRAAVKEGGVKQKKRFSLAYEDVDKALLVWFRQAQANGVPLSGPILIEKGEELARALGHYSFEMSRGWIDRFKSRHGIVIKGKKMDLSDSDEQEYNIDNPEVYTDYDQGASHSLDTKEHIAMNLDYFTNSDKDDEETNNDNQKASEISDAEGQIDIKQEVLIKSEIDEDEECHLIDDTNQSSHSSASNSQSPSGESVVESDDNEEEECHSIDDTNQSSHSSVTNSQSPAGERVVQSIDNDNEESRLIDSTNQSSHSSVANSQPSTGEKVVRSEDTRMSTVKNFGKRNASLNTLRHKIGDEYQPNKSGLARVEASGSTSNSKKSVEESLESVKKRQVDGFLFEMIRKELHPFSIVRNHGFKALCHILDPRYELPSKKELKQKTVTYYVEKKRELTTALWWVESISIATDVWMSEVDRGSCNLTISAYFLEPGISYKVRSVVLATHPLEKDHSAIDVADVVKEVMEEFLIQEKVFAITSYNILPHLEVYHIRCFAHCLNSVVEEAIKATDGFRLLVDNVRDVIDFFYNCSEAAEALLSRRMDQSISELLVNDKGERWNSTFKMLRSYATIHEFVNCVLKLLGKTDLILSDESTLCIESYCQSLEPFEEVVQDLCEDDFFPLSKVLVVVRQLKDCLITNSKSQLSTNLLYCLTSQFENRGNDFVTAAATLLDPRFKRMPFTDLLARKKHEEKIVDMLKLYFRTDSVDQVHLPPKRKYMVSFVEKVNFAEKIALREVTGPQFEFDKYIHMPHLDLEKDPINWWNKHQSLFPFLHQIAKKYLSITATSIPAGRLFTEAGDLFSARRSYLSPDYADMVLFLNQAYKLL